MYYTAASVDGFIADRNNALDWLFQFGDMGGTQQHYARFMADVGALAMGSTTYEWLLAHDAGSGDPGQPRTWEYEQPTWVFSSRDLPGIEGADIRFARGDVAAVHAQMVEAAEGRNVWLVGGGDLVGQFHDLGLLDEVVVGVAPVFLGAGAPLLPRTITTPPLRLLSVEQFGDVFAMLTYRVAVPA